MTTIDFNRLGISKATDPFNYKLVEDMENSIFVLEAIEATGSTVKLSDIKTNSIYLVGNYHVLDLSISSLNVIVTLNDKILESVVVPSLSSSAISRHSVLISVDENDNDVDVVALRELIIEHNDIKRRILKKINQLAATIRDRSCGVNFPPYIPTTISSDDISNLHYMETSTKPCNLVFFDNKNPFTYLEWKGIVGLFDDSFTLTHVGLLVNGEVKVINIDEERYMLDDIDEIVGSNVYDYLSKQLEFYVSRI